MSIGATIFKAFQEAFARDRHYSTHSAEALFIQIQGKYYRLDPKEITAEEFNTAWDKGQSI